MKTATLLHPRRRKEGLIDARSRLLMLGSCFTTEVGRRLADSGINVCINPTGNLYNPLSAATTIANLEADKRYTADDLIENQGLWRSLDHHTRLAAHSPEEALARINASMAAGRKALLAASHVIVTFGTAFVFERRGRAVCNCHKLPDREFVRRRLSIDEITAAWQPIIDRHPEKKFIFTVSPIRHVADGLHGNQLSKATLLLAIEQLHHADYFEAYEVLMDELRDYKYYAEDLVHPSAAAVERIFELFTASYVR